MPEIFYKIGDVAEMLHMEQYTLRYLEHSLKLKIKRNERGERQYTEDDIDTLRLILKLKNEKGLNSTAIRMALENLSEQPAAEDNAAAPVPSMNAQANIALNNIRQATDRLLEQNQILMEQNRQLQGAIKALEHKISEMDQHSGEHMDELIKLWRSDQEERQKSWLSVLKRK